MIWGGMNPKRRYEPYTAWDLLCGALLSGLAVLCTIMIRACFVK